MNTIEKAKKIAASKAPTWKRGIAGGTKAQKDYASAIIQQAMAETLIATAITKGWGAAESRLDKLLAKIDRNAGKALDQWAANTDSGRSLEHYLELRIERAKKFGKAIVI